MPYIDKYESEEWQDGFNVGYHNGIAHAPELNEGYRVGSDPMGLDLDEEDDHDEDEHEVDELAECEDVDEDALEDEDDFDEGGYFNFTRDEADYEDHLADLTQLEDDRYLERFGHRARGYKLRWVIRTLKEDY